MAAWEFQSLQNIAKESGWHQFISMQDYYSLIYREEEREMIPYCRATGVGLIPYSPLARGLLARPFKSEPTPRQKNDPSSGFLLGKISDADLEIIGRVEKLAEDKGTSMSIISILWALEKGVTPIVGLASTERIDEAVKAVELFKQGTLTKEDVAFLDDAYLPKAAIPYM
jgi:aryl-alcohol dehydrogenase-like predicted oxidoreductase